MAKRQGNGFVVVDWPHSRRGGEQVGTPAAWRVSLQAMLTGLAGYHPGVSVVVGPGMAVEMGLLDRPAAFPDVEGWNQGHPRPWVSFKEVHGGRRVHLGFWPWMAAAKHGDREWPLFAGLMVSDMDAWQVCQRAHMWRVLSGCEYRGTPGVTGTVLLRDTHSGTRTGSRVMWHLSPQMMPEGDAYEPELRWQRKTRHESDGRYGHVFDRRMAYLAAAATVPTAAGPLYHRAGRGQEFDPGLSGWWRIIPERWGMGDCLPSPLAGTVPDKSGSVWVTTPTMTLLTDLRERGWHGGYRLLESWTGTGRRVLRPWAERIRDLIYETSRPDSDRRRGREYDQAGIRAVYGTARACYRQTIGMFAAPGGAVYRPDWHHAVIAQSRVTVWRQALRIGDQTGRWPARFMVDSLTYTSDSDRATAANPGLDLSERLGGWRIAGQPTREDLDG